MVEEIIAKSATDATVWVPILVLFAWLLRWVMQESKRREDRAHEREEKLMNHNERYQEILKRQSDLLEQQNNVHKEQSEQLGELTLVIKKMRIEMENIKEQVTDLWGRIK